MRNDLKRKDEDEHGLPSLSRVFGYIAVKEIQKREEQVKVLARLGYGNAEIAKIVGSPVTSVRTLKSQSKKVPRKRTRKP